MKSDRLSDPASTFQQIPTSKPQTDAVPGMPNSVAGYGSCVTRHVWLYAILELLLTSVPIWEIMYIGQTLNVPPTYLLSRQMLLDVDRVGFRLRFSARLSL